MKYANNKIRDFVMGTNNLPTKKYVDPDRIIVKYFNFLHENIGSYTHEFDEVNFDPFPYINETSPTRRVIYILPVLNPVQRLINRILRDGV